jgi:hypothetical protein
MDLTTALLFVGADNATGGTLDVPRIESLVAKNHPGFTTWRADGHWEGMSEDIEVVMISDTHERIMETVALLKRELGQDSIGIEIMPPMEFA